MTPVPIALLQGASNFRDVGGYLTLSGQRIKRGQVFRSDHLAGLTAADLAQLQQIGVTHSLDFRGVAECAATPYAIAGVDRVALTIEPSVIAKMQALVAQTGESVAFHVRQGAQRLCLYRVDSPQLLRDHVRAGDVLPLERGAGGRVLMAFSGAKGQVYEQVRQDGYILAIGDRVPGLVGVSAPVWKAGGQLVGALTLTVPESRFKAAFVEALRASAAALCAQLA